jgi:crossover junction endodeoxyribonuclease RusA
VKIHAFTVRGKLISLNAERSTHFMPRSEAIRQWRTDSYWEAKAAGLPHLDRVSVIVQPVQHRSVLQDAGNCYPVAKACIDGLCDAGVLDGDDGQYVTALTMLAPKRATNGTDYITIELVQVAPCR